MYLGCGANSSIGMRILACPRRKLIQLYFQLCLIFADRSQGLPSSIGYAPEVSRASITAEISKRCPLMMIPNFRIKPKGLTERVSAMRSQNGQASHSEIPNCAQVFALITFTPEPPSILHPATSCPCRNNLIARLLCSTTVGPSLISVKLAEAVMPGLPAI